ncbi:putative calcium uniporter protein, mitochondrial [Eremomyces bilateralis CBS 781.70]|uniref:Calcium uniporter protein n=1 Tax=Eremomyces bilateralis CBS 781.70 TaxID=1392243 RepID=A0A6G1G291_9PEZI|nr:putative calcium uniporter protein, mitochondrial [Eremomyces bilateralis CBS 781.70]KAF1812163.1 putative calcium uniporter protein, mitochondrial [Eremomyces bilateralis CBS 781.70]
MTKGKILTTPSRMLKLILPLTTRDYNADRKNVEPLALLVHPQQPLSYLERLIQAELPFIKHDGKDCVPNVYFRAVNSIGDRINTAESDETDEQHNSEAENVEDADEVNIDGKVQKTGKLKDASDSGVAESTLRGRPGEGGVESYSGLGQDRKDEKLKEDEKFVRWSSSTELGDFIRDAARAKTFAVEIEGAPNQIMVGVPSFKDRTYYLRMRLRKKSHQIAGMADLKKECNQLAHRGARRMALGGFGVLVVYWYMVYRLTFETDLGWEFMEPVTYLVGLSTLIGGYVWFLYHNREVSYQSAMNFSISRRQSKLYNQKGFDVHKWQTLIEEGNALRREVKAVASEYDVDWNEAEDEQDEKVVKALKKGAKKAKKRKEEEDDKDKED